MKLWIFLRNTEDWGNVTLEHFQDGKISTNNDPSINQHAKDRFLNSISLWNKNLSLNYFDFRNEIKELATSTWKDIPVVIEDINTLINKIEDDDIVLPLDDDDWLHPEFENIVIHNCLDEICVLNQVVFDTRDWSISRWNNEQLLGSSHVLFRASLLKTIDKKSRFHFLKYHPWIYKTAQETNTKIAIMNNMPILICYLSTFGSFSKMTAPNVIYNKWEINEATQLTKIPDLCDETMWCKNHIEKFKQITDKIKRVVLL